VVLESRRDARRSPRLPALARVREGVPSGQPERVPFDDPIGGPASGMAEFGGSVPGPTKGGGKAVRAAIVWRLAHAVAVVSLGAVGVAGCGTAPTAIRANIVATADVNPDARGRPSPVVVKVFELKSLAAFETADFFSLFDKDKETLGGELLARDEFSLSPGDKQAIARELKPEARYVGVVAGFRDLERATWRAAIPVPPKKTTSIIVRLESRKVSITTQ
jgi:type VI secretion system protein VasD